jgi:hypothetical protein
MKKRIHILTADEHRKLMVDPDIDWIKECSDPKYRERYFVAIDPYGLLKDERAPQELAELRADVRMANEKRYKPYYKVGSDSRTLGIGTKNDLRARGKDRHDTPTDELKGQHPTTKYVWPVLDTTGMRIYGKPAAYFTSHEAAKEWVERENALCPPPLKPPVPQPPYPMETYYALETVDTYADQPSTHLWEIRQVSNPVSKKHKMPYQRKHYVWSEKTISVHQTREEVKQKLITLITKK